MVDRTLVIIPAYQEEAALPAVLDELARLGAYDVLVVDDGSIDATAEVAKAKGAVVAQLPFNLGIGAALRTGFRYAHKHGYERVVQLDADGQHDPNEIPLLLAQLDAGADMVVGTRFLESGSVYEVGRLRFGAMRFLRLAVHLLAGQRFSDTSSGFRGFSKSMTEFFARTYPQEYMESVEALLLACYGGFRVVEIPAEMRQRAGGRPSSRNFKLLYHYIRLLIVMVTTAPVRGRMRRRSA